MNVLTDSYRRTAIRVPPAIPDGLDAVVHTAVGVFRGGNAASARLLEYAAATDSDAGTWKTMTDETLSEKLREFKTVFRRRAAGYDSCLLSALAAIREAAERRVGLRPYPVQLAGAIGLYEGNIVEMATGEGKTLTASLACIMNGWTGRPCHIVTVNDYLAQRDAEWLRRLYEFCGVSVGYVTGEMEPAARRAGYSREVTYTTSKELIADFLRDRLVMGDCQNASRRDIRAFLERGARQDARLVMRGIHSAVVDEADSILVDEAVTPLIISRAQQNQPFVEACLMADRVADRLEPGRDYRADRKYNDIELGDGIRDRLSSETRQMAGMARGFGRRTDLIKQALTAREFYHRDRQYVVQDGKVVIVDEFTGRMMPQRTWRSGLHQFIEAKEDLTVTPPSETLARLSFQRFFRFFRKLSGMTGTAQESAQEFWWIHRLPTIRIPENRPCIRIVRAPRVFADEESKWRAVVVDIAAHHAAQRPVLAGTRSVRASENLAGRLTRIGLPFRLLNAVRHREEARIVAHAGEKSAITIATNMAGRGTDIILESGVAQMGGLHVIATECHESHRIDRQLFGRCARQGDPGTARAFISMEDELIRRYVGGGVRKAVAALLARGTPGRLEAALAVVRSAQARAERLAFRRRRQVLKMDTWIDDSLSFAHSDVN